MRTDEGGRRGREEGEVKKEVGPSPKVIPATREKVNNEARVSSQRILYVLRLRVLRYVACGEDH